MEKDAEITKVIFRKYSDGEIIAIFPEIPGTHEWYTCSSYLQTGQHGACDPIGVIMNTKPALRSEYADIGIELENLGYNLKVYDRYTRKMFRNRKQQLDSVK